MEKPIELVYPIYLDTVMMSGFLAALEDGIAYDADITSQKVGKRNVGGEVEGNAKLPSFISILGIDMRGKLSGAVSAENNEEVKLLRKHTEASLLIRLRHKLNNQITRIDSIGDLTKITHGSLIESSGTILRNPLVAALDAIVGTLDVFGIELDTQQQKTQIKPAQSPPVARRNNGKPNKPNTVTATISDNQAGPEPMTLRQQIDQLTANDETMFSLRLMNRMRIDLLEANILDVVMYPVQKDNRPVVISLSKEFITAYTMQHIISGQFTVLGKVTRVIDTGETLSLYQRAAYSYLNLDDLVTNLTLPPNRNNPFQSLENASVLKGPVIQVLPLAIYV